MEARIYLRGATRPIFRPADRVYPVDYSMLSEKAISVEEFVRKLGISDGTEVFLPGCDQIDSIEVAKTFRRDDKIPPCDKQKEL